MATTTPGALTSAAKQAFLLLDTKGKGTVTRIDTVLALQKLNAHDLQVKAPKMEAWLSALAQPRTFSNIFDAMNASKSGYLSLDEFSSFVQEQQLIQQQEREEAEQRILEEKVKEQNAALKIEALARGRADRTRVVQLRRRRKSAVLIQNQIRVRQSKKKVKGVRIEKKRQIVKAKKRKKYRNEMKERKKELNSRYHSVEKRKGTLSSKELQHATEKIRKRALLNQRKKKLKEAARLRKIEDANAKKKAQLLRIPGFGRRTNERKTFTAQPKKKGGKAPSKATDKEKEDGQQKEEEREREVEVEEEATEIQDNKALEHNTTPNRRTGRKLKKNSSPTIERIVIKAYSMGVAFGLHGVGYRLSIEKHTPWISLLDKLEAKFDQRGDVGAVGVVRDEDGCEIQNTNELVDGDRIFVCRVGEEWARPRQSNTTEERTPREVEEGEAEKGEDKEGEETTRTTASPIKNQSEWSSSTYEAPFFRDMRSEDPTATIFETRENETLSVTSVGGVGRLVVT